MMIITCMIYARKEKRKKNERRVVHFNVQNEFNYSRRTSNLCHCLESMNYRSSSLNCSLNGLDELMERVLVDITYSNHHWARVTSTKQEKQFFPANKITTNERSHGECIRLIPRMKTQPNRLTNWYHSLTIRLVSSLIFINKLSKCISSRMIEYLRNICRIEKAN